MKCGYSLRAPIQGWRASCMAWHAIQHDLLNVLAARLVASKAHSYLALRYHSFVPESGLGQFRRLKDHVVGVR